jgi:hypothetical protein
LVLLVSLLLSVTMILTVVLVSRPISLRLRETSSELTPMNE